MRPLVPRPASQPRAMLTAALATGGVTMLGFAGRHVSTMVAALAYVVAVTVAAAREGLVGGLAASLLSFLGLTFVFTPPRYTLSVEKGEDLVALLVFLAVAAIVGTLLSSSVAQKQRAERREQEARLLHRLANRLLSTEPLQPVARRLAESLADLLDLGRCEIDAAPLEPIRVERAEHGPLVSFPLATEGGEIGVLRAAPRAGRELHDDDREVIRTFAGTLALALERARLAEQASRARLDAEESRLRAALFSSVTHDLRTPLASITAAATSLEDEDAVFDAKDRRELLETVRQEAERLDRLVGNLMDIARMRAGALTPAKRTAGLDEIIESVLARMQPQLAAHEVEMKVRDDLPEAAVDVVQVDQVLTNLVENAAKFSPGGTTITVSAVAWQGSVEVRVIDHGPGIAEADRDRVFEPFARGDASAPSGTGLGLSIAGAIVAAHGGRIWIEGTPGGGTTVAFTLPIEG